jgi:hypothetical protein
MWSLGFIGLTLLFSRFSPLHRSLETEQFNYSVCQQLQPTTDISTTVWTLDREETHAENTWAKEIQLRIGGLEVPTAVTMESSSVWDVTPCSLVKVSRCFVGTHRLHLQELCLPSASCWLLSWLTLLPWRWRRYVPPKCRLNFTRLHGVISQNIKLFKMQDYVKEKYFAGELFSF